jgi:ATP-dependent Clp protease ATP-binding subunit ClpX
MESLKVPTPREIIACLDRHVISQDDAKETIAIAVSNHFARQGKEHHTPEGTKVDKFSQPNILVIGHTGSGKTLCFESLGEDDTLGVPFAIIDTSKCTESGYVGDKVENALITLWIRANYDLERAQMGIIYFDEFDKIAKPAGNTGLDVSREGVQRGLLSLFGGTKIRLSVKGMGGPDPKVEYIDFDTSKVQFACGGAFPGLERIIEKRVLGDSTIGFGGNVVSREENEGKAYEYLLQVEDEDLINYGLIPELVGRLPYRTAVMKLTAEELYRILVEPRNCLVDQYKALFRKKNILLKFTDDALMAIAEDAAKTKTGARALQRILEAVLRATELLSPREKEITRDDVENRRQKKIEARALLRKLKAAAKTEDAPKADAGEPSIITVFLDASKQQKEMVCLNLAVPSAMWEVYRDGTENDHLRLMQTQDNRLFYVIRREFWGSHNQGCGHKTEGLACEWIVPHHQGVHPVELIGRHVPVRWVCGGCRQTIKECKLDLGEARWKDGRAADPVIPPQVSDTKSSRK